ncbi:MAG TPA: hypothetical protein VMB18_19870 [Terriglobales bacterium]|nr:hypothetical protein [Terriglobales bacterium]
MKEQKIALIAASMLALILGFALGRELKAQVSKKDGGAYSAMAPIEQYLMDRDAEIMLARSGAPESISRDATVMVLGNRSFETAVEGKNGFVCIVERAWTSPFESAEFWNPKNRSPICYNPQAARTVLPITYMRTKLALAGLSKEQIRERMKAAVDGKEITPPEPGAMCFMMGKGGYLSDQSLTADGAHNIAHVMFFTSRIKLSDWGANLDNSPIFIDPRHNSDPEPINVFMMMTGTWSDGTATPLQ